MSFATVVSLGVHEPRVRARLTELAQARVMERLWKRDVDLWAKDDAARRTVANRLGWLDAPTQAAADRASYESFAAGVRHDGFQQALILGMGGSSLCPEVLRRSFPPSPGFLPLTILDSTDPAAVLAVERSLPLARTLFVVSSKSGTTTETLSLYRYFWAVTESARPGGAASAFVAITDPGTPLETDARDRQFRHVFPGPVQVGGRYSALTPFGLVPAALLGCDLDALLTSAAAMAASCRQPGEENPALFLGTALGELALSGRDKVTVVVDPPLSGLGLWLEQLLAESLGKEGKGLVPVPEPSFGGPDAYGDDRLFVHVSVGTPRVESERALGLLESAGHPVIRLGVAHPNDLGGEAFRWEAATAVAGHVLGVDPFDEPNVSESKENTKEVLESFRSEGRFATETPLAAAPGVEVFGAPGAPVLGGSAHGEEEVMGRFEAWLRSLAKGRYLAIQAYLPPDPENEAALLQAQRRLRDRTRLAVTVGFGPRFLHSTGQLHKGGPPIGSFLQITAGSPAEVPVPGAPYAFETLIRAQAIGDAHSLARRRLPFLRLHFPDGADSARIRSWLERFSAGPAR